MRADADSRVAPGSDPKDPVPLPARDSAIGLNGSSTAEQGYYVDAMGRRRRRGVERHGASSSAEYRAWSNMIKRCENPAVDSYPGHGGRGIRVCDKWRRSFVSFLADMGPRPSPEHSLDRIDNDGNYEPGNCRWATRVVQMRNTRDNRRLSWRGETLTVTEWAERTGIPRRTIFNRFHNGWSIERCLNVPMGGAPRGRYGWGRKSRATP